MTKSPWGLDNLRELHANASKEQQDAIKDLCSIYAATFNNSNGKKVLDILEKTLNKPTWDPEKDEKFGYYREGQNDIIRHIFSRINLAKEL